VQIVTKKRIKTGKPNIPSQVGPDGEPSKSAEIKDPEQQIKMLLEKGEKKGFLTYEEMNEQLPEEAISPGRLDGLLETLDEMGISLLDEADVESQQLRKAQEAEFETSEESLAEEEADKEQQLKKEDVLLEKQLIGEDVSRRIDDPIRMYLTQMGQIPLLTRKSEIALARKIEMTRMGFRRKMLNRSRTKN
jgi:RNA polymerase primary sigma factor